MVSNSVSCYIGMNNLFKVVTVEKMASSTMYELVRVGHDVFV